MAAVSQHAFACLHATRLAQSKHKHNPRFVLSGSICAQAFLTASGALAGRVSAVTIAEGWESFNKPNAAISNGGHRTGAWCR